MSKEVKLKITISTIVIIACLTTTAIGIGFGVNGVINVDKYPDHLGIGVIMIATTFGIGYALLLKKRAGLIKW